MRLYSRIDNRYRDTASRTIELRNLPADRAGLPVAACRSTSALRASSAFALCASADRVIRRNRHARIDRHLCRDAGCSVKEGGASNGHKRRSGFSIRDAHGGAAIEEASESCVPVGNRRELKDHSRTRWRLIRLTRRRHTGNHRAQGQRKIARKARAERGQEQCPGVQDSSRGILPRLESGSQIENRENWRDLVNYAIPPNRFCLPPLLAED